MSSKKNTHPAICVQKGKNMDDWKDGILEEWEKTKIQYSNHLTIQLPTIPTHSGINERNYRYYFPWISGKSHSLKGGI